MLGSSQQLLLHVLEIPFLLHVLLMETTLGSPPGEWAGEVSVPCHIDQLPLFLSVGLAMPSQPGLGMGLEQLP